MDEKVEQKRMQKEEQIKDQKKEQKNGQKNDQRKETNCDFCAYYMYDEDYDEYVCDVNMDEDDFYRLMSQSRFSCPYYKNGDEYKVVRKQM